MRARTHPAPRMRDCMRSSRAMSVMSVYCTRGILGGAIGHTGRHDGGTVSAYHLTLASGSCAEVLCWLRGLSSVGPLCVFSIKQVDVDFEVVLFSSSAEDLQLLRVTRRRIQEARQAVNG